MVLVPAAGILYAKKKGAKKVPKAVVTNKVDSPESVSQGKLCKKIGATGFEPATSWSQTKRSTKLSYAPGRRTLVGRFLLGKKRLENRTPMA